jgi:hypothetical protein
MDVHLFKVLDSFTSDGKKLAFVPDHLECSWLFWRFLANDDNDRKGNHRRDREGK